MVSQIQRLIESASSPEIAARTIVIFLDNAGLDLIGNGWLDDDPLWESLSEDDLERLSDRVDEILQVENV